MSKRLCMSVVLLMLLALTLLSGLALAQAPPGAEAAVATSFVGAGFGARAIGMGGAFVAVADDATAVFWNPAGLAQLEEAEVSLVLATATALKMYGYLDWQQVAPLSYLGTPRITDRSIDAEGFGLDFLSVVFPQRGGDQRSVWALSYSRDGRYEEQANFFDPGIPGFTATPLGYHLINTETEFRSTTLAYAWGDDEDMYGISLIQQDADFYRRWTEVEFGPPTLTTIYVIDDDDSGLGWQAGWLGKRDTTSYGITYRSSGGQDVRRVDEYPANWSAGVAFQPREDFKWALAYRSFEEVEDNYVVDYAMDSYHIGAEWLHETEQGFIPLRLGYYRRDLDKSGLDATNVFTIGSGVSGPRWSFDVAIEFGSDDFRRYTVSLVGAM